MRLDGIIEDIAFNLIQLAVTELPADVKEALNKAYKLESSDMGKTQLKNIIENFDLSEKRIIPMCQDTGLIEFYVSIGDHFNFLHEYTKSLITATKKATLEIPLRPNAVHPFTRRNTGNNTGLNIPRIHFEIIKGDFMDLQVFPKGAGSENMSQLRLLNPNEGVEGVMKFVIDSVINAGAKPCPPTIIGLGVGGSADYVMELAKKALLRPLNKQNSKTELAELEEELTKLINMTGIGPMGLGGSITTLGVNMELAYCHTASLPVGVIFQCWAARRAKARINSNGEVAYLTHKR